MELSPGAGVWLLSAWRRLANRYKRAFFFCKGELLYNAPTCLKPGGFPGFQAAYQSCVICISLQVGKKIMGKIVKGEKENKTPTPSARWWK